MSVFVLYCKKDKLFKLVEKCLKGTAPSYFSKYFQLKRHDSHGYDIRNENKLVIDRVKLESTKQEFFKKAQIFLIIVYESSSSLFISFYIILYYF